MKPKKKQSGPAALPCGVYRHYKGNDYLVLGVAQHSETEAYFVVYVRLYPREGGPFWVRPLDNFCGMTTNVLGKKVKRFKFVGRSQPKGWTKA